MLNIHTIEKSNHVNGSGNRYVIWVQGCDLTCQGCWNQETWSREPKHLMVVEEIFEDIVGQLQIEGVTLTGGEPFLQEQALSRLAHQIKTQTDLSLQVFSGFRLEEIADSPLLPYIDTLVAGRYGEEQKVYHFGEDQWVYDNESIEIEITDDGDLVVTGYPSEQLLKELEDEQNR